MNVHLPAPRRGWPARLVNLAVVVVVLALAAATFVLSYTGMHAIALEAGVSARLARIYPGVFDAVLLIACVAAMTLRDARWWARCYAWLAIIVVAAVAGAADAVHAMNVALPRRETEGVVAAAPWVLVLLGFSLMLTVLRQSRAQHSPATAPGRMSRRAARHAADQPLPEPAIAIEQTVELARNPVSAPAPPPTEPPPAEPPLAEPQAGEPQADEPQADEHPPTLEVPVLAELQTSPTAPAAELAAPDDQAAAQEAPAEQGQLSSFLYGTTPERGPWAIEDAAPDSGKDAIVSTETTSQAPSRHSWVERVADSGDPSLKRHDYWDTDDQDGHGDKRSQPASADNADDDESPFTTVPRLNRVHATPIPPEEDEE